MTLQEYYAAVRRLGLKPTSVPHVFATAYGDFHNVPDAERHTPEQRAETIDVLKGQLGVSED